MVCWLSEARSPAGVADEIWHKILEFGHYGFNKSHSASYALQAYQDMWLKMHYPLEFYASFLTFEDDENKKMTAIREARSRNMKILPPSVQTSNIGWTVDEDAEALRMGLMAIKGVGAKGAAEIIKQRAYGLFDCQAEFRQRVPPRAINSKAMIALTEAGAFDCFDARADADDEQIAAWEKERLGMSLTVIGGTDKYAETLRQNIYTQYECSQLDSGSSVIIGGEITKVDKKLTKRGDPFANVTIIFELNEWRVKFWKEALAEYEDILKPGNAVMISGKTNSVERFHISDSP